MKIKFHCLEINETDVVTIQLVSKTFLSKRMSLHSCSEKRKNKIQDRGSSMIHSARPTIPPSSNHCFHLKVFLFCEILTTCVKIVITTDRDSGSASWIIKKRALRTISQNFFLPWERSEKSHEICQIINHENVFLSSRKVKK